ncbi:hypothetical protein ACE0DR_28775 [Azotobacter sp. CWF10]
MPSGQANVVVLFLLQQVLEIGLHIGTGEAAVAGRDVLQERAHACLELADERADGFIDQRLLAAEMMEQRTLADTGGLRDVLHGQRGQAHYGR